jgi:hypothetical protein
MLTIVYRPSIFYMRNIYIAVLCRRRFQRLNKITIAAEILFPYPQRHQHQTIIDLLTRTLSLAH